ncbi:MAG: hypothetical protein AAF732_09985, partial [Pseudomonadota bacterium]
MTSRWRWKWAEKSKTAQMSSEKADQPVAAPEDTDVAQASDADVSAFITQMTATAPRMTGDRGRLIFAMDATMSRQPTWDMALALQGDMFRAVKDVGGL